jgi:8-oxo-dGTP diphosphatase
MTKRRSDEDEVFLATYDASRYEHPSVAVDVALCAVADGDLRTLLLRRPEPPQRGRHALPGTFVGMSEPLEATAARALETKLGVTGVFLEQLYTFGAPKRDPRTRVITVAYYALLDEARLAAAAEDAEGKGGVVASLHVPWDGVEGGPVEARDAAGEPLTLAFDHAEILGMMVQRLRGKLDYTPIGFELLPARFTLAELLRVHETILGRPLNKDSFRRRMVASGMIAATGDFQEATQHRPAELFVHARLHARLHARPAPERR